MYAILLSHGQEQIKCKSCGGEGTLNINGSLKTCRLCSGTGTRVVLDEALRVLRNFYFEGHFTISHEHGVHFEFRGARLHIEDMVLKVMAALSVSGIKTRLVWPVF